jgi:hypothetical protein
MASTLHVGSLGGVSEEDHRFRGQDIHGVDIASWLTWGSERAPLGEDPGNLACLHYS